jgi:hypothetical protein
MGKTNADNMRKRREKMSQHRWVLFALFTRCVQVEPCDFKHVYHVSFQGMPVMNAAVAHMQNGSANVKAAEKEWHNAKYHTAAKGEEYVAEPPYNHSCFDVYFNKEHEIVAGEMKYDTSDDDCPQNRHYNSGQLKRPSNSATFTASEDFPFAINADGSVSIESLPVWVMAELATAADKILPAYPQESKAFEGTAITHGVRVAKILAIVSYAAEEDLPASFLQTVHFDGVQCIWPWFIATINLQNDFLGTGLLKESIMSQYRSALPLATLDDLKNLWSKLEQLDNLTKEDIIHGGASCVLDERVVEAQALWLKCAAAVSTINPTVYQKTPCVYLNFPMLNAGEGPIMTPDYVHAGPGHAKKVKKDNE